MTNTQETNRDQIALWNDASGCNWLKMQDVVERILVPFEELLIAQAFPGEGGRVLDIGCGAGATTLAMARRLGPAGQCLGVDISEPLLTAARARATEDGVGSARFVQADAQTHAFEPASFDAAISRFGVMFFEDPQAAFINIQRAMRPGGKLAFVAWRSPAENPFMTAAARAAAPLLPDLRRPEPNAPGQFGFADGDRVQRILQASGWKGISVRPIDVSGVLTEKEMRDYVTTLGPVGLALRGADEATRVRVTERVHAAFEPYVQDGEARFTMACWLMTACA